MADSQFTWIPLYTELAHKLVKWESRQAELIDLIEEMRADDLTVTPVNDEDADGNSFLIQEIDPFTFFGVFNRGVKDETRIEILKRLKSHFDCSAALPTDFDGIPILNNQKSWLIGYSHLRQPDDVAKLWWIFRVALSEDPLKNPEFESAYNAARKVKQVSNNLTMGLFWIRPDVFLSTEKKNRKYFELPNNVSNTAQSYTAALAKIRQQHKESFPELSHKAHVHSINPPANPSGTPQISNEQTFWFVGAYWKRREPPEQTSRFLKEGIWQNGYKDRYPDKVRSMQVGDRIAIKSAHTQRENLPFDAYGNTVSKMLIRAVGTIVGNREDGRTVDVAWDETWKPKDWYFFTYQATVWKLTLHEDYKNREYAEKLIRFAFFDEPQDIDWFLERWYGEEDDGDVLPGEESESGPSPYSLDDIVEDGAFVPKSELKQMLTQLQLKQNLILQGPPGVGKTFLARRLAYALLEETDADRTKLIQFHQSYSYEDFVRGYRPQPGQEGAFALQDAVFFTFCEQAREDPDRKYVLMIDEINRGNLSQILGELMMLIEADKRNAAYALPLMYSRPDEPDFFVPENMYIIGMMNLADRSLAIVDYALRRRFSFSTLVPRFESSEFRNWLLNRQMAPSLVETIVTRLTALNQQVAEDKLLGPNYLVGHSFFCPQGTDFSDMDRSWFDTVIDMEIVPLLREYWFDDSGKADEARDQLLAP
jgi:5-methylcytosine-specific restriction protein B